MGVRVLELKDFLEELKEVKDVHGKLTARVEVLEEIVEKTIVIPYRVAVLKLTAFNSEDHLLTYTELIGEANIGSEEDKKKLAKQIDLVRAKTKELLEGVGAEVKPGFYEGVE